MMRAPCLTKFAAQPAFAPSCACPPANAGFFGSSRCARHSKIIKVMKSGLALLFGAKFALTHAQAAHLGKRCSAVCECTEH